MFQTGRQLPQGARSTTSYASGIAVATHPQRLGSANRLMTMFTSCRLFQRTRGGRSHPRRGRVSVPHRPPSAA
eukprot:5535160-Heterocapsa_arctica.AAC.1